MLKPVHLATLRAVCQTGSFAVAARDLGYTSSAVSQQIAALEKDTGLVLFERGPRGIQATAAAGHLVEASTRVLAVLDDLEHQVRQLATGSAGRVRLGSFPTASARLVPVALAAMARARPDAEVTLEEAEPEELIGRVLDGSLDVALAYEYGLCPRHWPDEVIRHPLLREEILLLQPHNARLHQDLSQLARQRWIASAYGSAGSQSLTRLCAAAGFTPNVAFRSNNYDVVRELVAENQGVALVPSLGHVPHGRIVATPLTQPSAHRTVMLLYRLTNTNPLLPTLLSALVDVLPPGLRHIRRLHSPA